MSLISYRSLIFCFMIKHIFAGTTDDRSPVHDLSLGGFITFGAISLFCVLFGGLMSGLTVGLLGIDELELEIKLSNGSTEERANARKILAVINHHHLLLVTLLLANSIAMEALPLFLDEMFNTEITVILSVSFVLAFGEVIPQALCTGPNQMKIATKMIPIVKFLMIILLPISYPIAKLLDLILDHKSEGVKLKSDDLKTFISLHQSFLDGPTPEPEGLEKFQITMMHGIIDLSKAKVKKHMMPYKNFLKLNIETPVSKEVVEKIINSYYHYLPIYKQSKSNLVGVIAIQELFKIWEGDVIENSDIVMNEPVLLSSKVHLLHALKEMEAAQSTIAFVITNGQEKKKIIGVVTKEMILNKVLCSNNVSERSEIASISHALVDTLDKFDTPHKKVITPLRENLL